MSPLFRPFRRLLRRRGLQLSRITTPLHDLDEFMAGAGPRRAGQPALTVDVFDHEPRIQRTLVRALGPAGLRFHGLPDQVDGSPVPTPPAGPSWLVVGGAWAQGRHLAALGPLATAAEVVLVRLDPAFAGPEELALPEAEAFAAAAGLTLDDILTSVQPVPFNAAAHRAFLLFRRQPEAAPVDGRIRRLDEGRAFLAPPLTRRAAFRALTGRGFLGFGAGVFNPGTWEEQGRLTMILRADRVPWAEQERDERIHLSSSAAVIGRLDATGDLIEAAPLRFVSALAPQETRTEDYRLFGHRGRLYCNHSLIVPPGGRQAAAGPLHVELMHTRVAISELDPEGRELRLLGTPRLDFAVRSLEKNWAFFSADGAVHVIYSVAPYRLLRAPRWPELNFTSVVRGAAAYPFSGDGRSIRNSINPVPYDDRHFLHIVHKVYPHKQYVFWALLIDRRTLLPAFVLDRPLVRAGPSVAAAIVYACSAVVRPAEVLVFAGVDDCAAGYWRVGREDLDRHWKPLPGGGGAP